MFALMVRESQHEEQLQSMLSHCLKLCRIATVIPLLCDGVKNGVVMAVQNQWKWDKN